MSPAEPDTDRCPSMEVLEALASGDEASPEALAHIAECATCREAVAEIKENNRFLATFVSQVKSGAGSAEPQPARPDDLLPGYRVGAEIHRGGQGVVYEAVQMATKRRVAVKMLAQGAFASARQRRRFEREIEVVANLRHPNIVTIYDSATLSGGAPAYAMELIDGVPVNRYVSSTFDAMDRSHLGDTIRKKLRLFVKICDAVQHAHQRGVIHRDLKPGNVLVDESGEPHVLDFGLAKLQQPDATSVWSTRTGEFVGSIAYASPEQVKGDPDRIDTRSDVYSLGVMLYEMLTEQLPYPVTGSMSDIVRNITQVEPRKPSSLRRGLSSDIDTIIATAMAKDADRRYETAGALMRDVQRHLAGEPIGARRDSTWYVLRKMARRHRGPATVAALVLVLLVAFALTMSALYRRTTYHMAATQQQLVISNIERGRALANLGNVAGAEQLLWSAHLADRAADDGADPDPRGALDTYWALWEMYARQPCLATLKHNAELRQIALHPSGRLVTVGASDGSCRLIDTQTLTERRHIRFENAAVSAAAFHPTGELLALVGDNGAIRLYDAPYDGAGRAFRQSGEAVPTLHFSPDGGKLAALTRSGTLHLWRVPGGEPLRTEVVTGSREILTFSFDVAGERLAALHKSGVISTWRLGGEDLLARIHIPHFPPDAPYRQVSISPDLRSVATWNRQEQVLRMWDLAGRGADAASPEGGIKRGRATLRWQRESADGQALFVRTMQFTRDSRTLCTGETAIRFWRAASGQLVGTLRGHGAPIEALALAARAGTLASAAKDRTLKLWERRPKQCQSTLTGFNDTVFGFDLNSDERLLVAGSNDRTARAWDLATREPVGILEGEFDDGVSSVMFLPASSGREETIVAGGYTDDPRIVLWRPREDIVISRLGGHERWTSRLAPDPRDPSRFASSSSDGTVKLWDAESGTLQTELTHAGGAVWYYGVFFTPDGTRLVACGSKRERNEGFVAIWNRPFTGEPDTLLDHRDLIREIAFSPDGTRLVAVGNDDSVSIWNMESLERIRDVRGHGADVYTVAFHPNGRMFATGGVGESIKLWDLRTGRELATLSSDQRSVFLVRFDRSGQRLLACGDGQVVEMWDLSHYDRHLAGNIGYQIQQAETSERRLQDLEPMRRWARDVRARTSVDALEP